MFLRSSLASSNQQQLQQVNEHKQINREQAEAEPSLATDDFDDFKGQERGCDDEGEVFGPNLLEVEPDTFDVAYGGVGKRKNADAAEDRVVQERRPVEDDVDET